MLNSVQNYGMMDYSVSFQSKGNKKKVVTTLADVVKKQKPLSQEEQSLRSIRNMIMKFKPDCKLQVPNEGIDPRPKEMPVEQQRILYGKVIKGELPKITKEYARIVGL